MTSLRRDFGKSAGEAKPKSPPPFSLRLSFDERVQLERDAAGKSLGAYVRERLFGKGVRPRRKGRKPPSRDNEALGRVLGALGASRLASNLNQLAKAVNTGSLPVTPETEKELREACAAVMAMRDELMRALGRGPDGAA